MAVIHTSDTKIVTPSIETITPRDAERFLGHNKHNRPLKATVIRRFAHDMTRGEWKLNGESIKFADSGVLLDGQHRLAAIVESGKPVTSLVIRGLPDDAQDTVDIGVKRSMGDILHLHGMADSNNLAAALTYLHKIRTKQLRYVGAGYTAPTPADLLDLLDANPMIVDSLSVARSLRKRLRVPVGMIAALHLWFSEIDSQDADEFFDRLGSGENLTQGNPIFALRRWLEQTAAFSKRVRVPLLHAYIVKTWNYYRADVEVHSLRFRMATDTWPEPE